MGRPLLERLALDLRPTGRISDCKRDLAEAERERAEIDQRIADCERRSEDPATPDDEAQLAHRQAADWRFHATRLDRAIAAVRDAIAAKEADESHLERRKQFDAVKASRDALVARWRALGPVWDDLMGLFADTVANDALLAAANRQRPGGEPALRSAEIEARGALNEAYWPNSIGLAGEPFQRLTAMDWPNLFGPGKATARRDDMRTAINVVSEGLGAAHTKSEAAKAPEALAAKARREAERWARYTVSQSPYSGTMIRGVRHREGVSGVDNEPVTLWMDAAQARAADRLGLSVKASPLTAAPVAERV